MLLFGKFILKNIEYDKNNQNMYILILPSHVIFIFLQEIYSSVSQSKRKE